MAMGVSVRIFSYLRELAGESVIHVDDVSFPCQLGDVIDRLVQKYPKLKSYLLNSKNRLNEFLHVIINGESLDTNGNTRDLLKYLVNDGDEIVILPPIGGG